MTWDKRQFDRAMKRAGYRKSFKDRRGKTARPYVSGIWVHNVTGATFNENEYKDGGIVWHQWAQAEETPPPFVGQPQQALWDRWKLDNDVE